MLRLIWRLRPFLAVGAAAVIVVNGDTSVDVRELRPLAAGPVPAAAPRVPGGPMLVTVGPSRLHDTRPVGALGAGSELRVMVLGRLGVPADHVGGVVLSVTVVGATQRTTVSVGPSGGRAAELIEARPGATASAVVTTGLGADGSVAVVHRAGEVHIVVDVAAYVVEQP